MYTAYVLKDISRHQLRQSSPPRFEEFVGHHITEQFGVPKDTPVPDKPDSVVVVGYSTDNVGLEAFVVEVNGTTERPDGGTYHLTWSLNRSDGYKPYHSNEVIAEHGWSDVAPIRLQVTPKLLN